MDKDHNQIPKGFGYPNPRGFEYILKRGSLLFRVQRSGMYQKLNFTVKYDEVPGGKIPYLCTGKIVESPELLRMAAETGLPISAKNGKFFPKGRTALDFLISTE